MLLWNADVTEGARSRIQGYHLLWPGFPSRSANARLCNFPTRRQTDQDEPYNPHATTTAVYHDARVWADPFSLATTQGVEVSFLSSGYLDVSVPQLASSHPMDSGAGTAALPAVSFLIRRSRDRRMVSFSPGLIAAAHVLHRLSVPRHPPCALVLLIRRTPDIDVAMEFSRSTRARAPSPSKLNSVRIAFVEVDVIPGEPACPDGHWC